MRFFKFLFYSTGLILGMILALCHNQQYPLESEFKIPKVSSKNPVVIDYASRPVLPDEVSTGKTLFKANCAQCHNRNMKDDLTGPALAGVQKRWSDYPKEDLYKWIRNSQALIIEKHPKAIELWDNWKPTIMTSYPNLSDEEIDAMLSYIDYVDRGVY